MRQHYKSSSNCYKNIFSCKGQSFTANGYKYDISSKEYFFTRLRDLRLDFCDLFAYEAMSREKKGDKSVVFTCTYNDEHIHNFYGINVLDSDDLHKRLSKASAFAKRLRRQYAMQFDYICVGEYGNGGESHNYVGKRGKGQNPHFHCVGWFSHIDGLVPKFNEPSYERLCLLLREAWQGCEEDDPKVYGLSKEMRAKGLGYLRLQGEIISPSKGCNYIAKYMGKDMLSLHQLAFEGILPTRFKSIALDYLREEFGQMDVLTLKDYEDIFCKWVNWLPVNHRLQKAYPPSTPHLSDELIQLMPYISQHLDDLYDAFLADFVQDVNRISPKLRHFKGFGMSILDYAIPEKGLYQRPLSTTCRALPASAKRKLYYDYSVSLVPNDVKNPSVQRYYKKVSKCNVDFVDVTRKYKKSVCYTLNKLGQQVLLKQTIARYEVRKLQLSSIGKMDCDYEVANLVLPFRHAMVTEDVGRQLCDLLNHSSDPVLYGNLYLKLVNVVAPDWFREQNDSMLFDVDIILALDYPKILKCVVDIENWYESLREKKNTDDRLFQEAWSSVYLSTY